MKAVIVECSNGAAVALCDDGSFKKLKNKGYFIGQELLLKQKASTNRIVRKLSICASLALVLLSFAGIGSYSYVKPYSYVSLDINPSIEYALNRYDKVISVSGINDKGQQVVSSIESDVKNQNITTALGVTLRQLEIDRYIVQEEYNHVIVSVCSDNDLKAQSIASSVNTFSGEETQVCSIDAMTVSKEIKDNADSLGITPGKLALIHAVAVSFPDSDFDVKEWTDKTVSELEITIQQASSQLPGSLPGETLINSEFLSSILDDSTTQKADSTAAASAVEAGTLTSSASTDQQTSITNNTTTGSSTNAAVSTSKPEDTGNTTIPAADSSTAAKPEGSGSTDKTGSPDTGAVSSGSSSADNINSTASQDNSAKPSDKNNGTGASKDPSSTTEKNQIDDSLVEESSSKKDSCPKMDAEVMEEDSKEDLNEEIRPDGTDDTSVVDDETSEIQDLPDGIDDIKDAEGTIDYTENVPADLVSDQEESNVLPQAVE